MSKTAIFGVLVLCFLDNTKLLYFKIFYNEHYMYTHVYIVYTYMYLCVHVCIVCIQIYTCI